MPALPPEPARRGTVRWPIILIAALFLVSAVLHFVKPLLYERIVPQWLPNAPLLVQLSGIGEFAGAMGVLWTPTRKAAGWGLILLLILVFPANVEMLRQAQLAGATRVWQTVLWLRLPLQGVLIWWVWRSAVRPPSLVDSRRWHAPAA